MTVEPLFSEREFYLFSFDTMLFHAFFLGCCWFTAAELVEAPAELVEAPAELVAAAADWAAKLDTEPAAAVDATMSLAKTKAAAEAE